MNMVYSIIQKSQLEGAGRIDAEYYQPEYLRIGKLLSTSKKMSDLTKTVDLQSNGAFAQIFTILNDNNDKVVPYVRSENLGDFFIKTDDLSFISKEAHERLLKTQTKLDDVLMARKGKIGGATLITKDAVGFNSNDNVVNIKINDKKYLDPYYFVTFFNCEIGLKQIERFATGNVQPWLSMYQIRNLKVFVPNYNFQTDIKTLILSAQSELINCQQLYLQAENYLLDELGLTDYETIDDLSYIVNYSHIENTGRIDADYFQPKYQKLVTLLKNKNAKNLAEVVQDAPARFIPEPSEKYKYIELANINSSMGIIDGFSEVLGKEAPSRARRFLKTGDVLVSSIQGSLGKTALVGTDQDGSLASTGFFQFRSNEFLPEVLLVMAKSVVLQCQLERECAGTILSAVPQESLKRLIIPVLPKEIQQKIADLVRKSHEARKKSKELLEEAKKKVEDMIESKN